MTWDDAKKAAEAMRPVAYFNITIMDRPIQCKRIYELTERIGDDGKIAQIVAALDRNGNCLYHDGPEKFMTA